jgi:hypothetical protein
MTVTRFRSTTPPWGRFVHDDCACTLDAPCLLHYDQDLDWKGQAVALTRAGIQPAAGR